MNVTELRHARGLYTLAELPQRGDVADEALGSGWWEFDQLWKIYPGQFTVMTGIPGHGKSTFALNLVCGLFRANSIRSVLYMPENEPHLRAKLRRIWGPAPGFEQFIANDCFVQSSRPEHYGDAVQDLGFVLDRAIEAIGRHETGFVLIDPWNELEFAKAASMSMTDYIRDCLRMLKQFTRAYEVSVMLIAHPTKAVAEDGGRVPYLSDIEGSMSWYNKADNGLVVYRETEPKSVRVISAKVREEGSGRLGVCHFAFDPKTGIFTPNHGGVSL